MRYVAASLVYNSIDNRQTHRITTVTLAHAPTVNNKYIQRFGKLWEDLGTRLMPWSAVLLARLQKLAVTAGAIPCYNIAKISNNNNILLLTIINSHIHVHKYRAVHNVMCHMYRLINQITATVLRETEIAMIWHQ